MTIVQGNVAAGWLASKGSRVSTVAQWRRERERERGTFGHINCGIPRRLPPVLGDSGSAHRHRFVSGSIFSSRHADGSDRSAVACGTRARHERGLGHRASGPALGPTYATNDAARLANRFFRASPFDFYVDPRNFDRGSPLSRSLSPTVIKCCCAAISSGRPARVLPLDECGRC